MLLCMYILYNSINHDLRAVDNPYDADTEYSSSDSDTLWRSYYSSWKYSSRSGLVNTHLHILLQ